MSDLPPLVTGDGEVSLLPDSPDPRCSFCISLAALLWPVDASSMRLCLFHVRLARQLQCCGWNQDTAHQAHAGRARAATFTTAYQRMAGQASFAACSARWRAVQGLPPLHAEDARRYLRPEHLHHLGLPLPSALRTRILAAWQAGDLRAVPSWLPPTSADAVR